MPERDNANGYRRGDRAFFHIEQTHDAIDKVALAPDLVLYVGAGATIDAGGPSWRQLISKLADNAALNRNRVLTSTEARILAKHLTPLEAATALSTYYERLSGRDKRRARTKILDRVRTHIYPDATWDTGQLTQAIAKFVIYRTVAAQRNEGQFRTRLVTTNYDTFLEEEIRRQIDLIAAAPEGEGIDEAAQLRVQAVTLSDPDGVFKTQADLEEEIGRPGTISIIYLHGRLSDNGELKEPLAITETDYNSLRPQVSAVLEWLFSGRSVLVVGSALTDPPLLTALQTTTNTGHSRFAMLPMPSIAANACGPLSREEMEALRKHNARRLEHFGVTMLAPDFFSQVAQFVQECVVAVVNVAPSERYSTQPTLRYGGRMTAWWDNWYGSRYCDERFRNDTQRRLRETAEQLRTIALKTADGTEDYRGEILKVEMWARWNPSHERCLALWASSDSIWKEESTLRTADMSLISEYAAVRSYIAGRPQLDHAWTVEAGMQKEDSPHVDRWRTFLSVPIHLDQGIGVLPVGVVTLASMADGERSMIRESNAATLEDFVINIRWFGVGAFSPGVPKRKSGARRGPAVSARRRPD